MIEFEYKGVYYVFTGLYREPQRGDYFLSDTGEVIQATCPLYHLRAIVHPARVTAEVEFKRTGEYRCAKLGEWYLDGAQLRYWHANDPSLCRYAILRPVEVLHGNH